MFFLVHVKKKLVASLPADLMEKKDRIGSGGKRPGMQSNNRKGSISRSSNVNGSEGEKKPLDRSKLKNVKDKDKNMFFFSNTLLILF